MKTIMWSPESKLKILGIYANHQNSRVSLDLWNFDGNLKLLTQFSGVQCGWQHSHEKGGEQKRRALHVGVLCERGSALDTCFYSAFATETPRRIPAIHGSQSLLSTSLIMVKTLSPVCCRSKVATLALFVWYFSPTNIQTLISGNFKD